MSYAYIPAAADTADVAAGGAPGEEGWNEPAERLLALLLLLLLPPLLPPLLLLRRAGQPLLLPRRSLGDAEAEVVGDSSAAIRATVMRVGIYLCVLVGGGGGPGWVGAASRRRPRPSANLFAVVAAAAVAAVGL